MSVQGMADDTGKCVCVVVGGGGTNMDPSTKPRIPN